MKFHSPVFKALAELYGESRAGRTGEWKNEFQPKLEDLLRYANCGEGDRREIAIRELRAAEKVGLVTLETIHPRDRSLIYKVRFSPDREAALFQHLGWDSPKDERAAWWRVFVEA